MQLKCWCRYVAWGCSYWIISMQAGTTCFPSSSHPTDISPPPLLSSLSPSRKWFKLLVSSYYFAAICFLPRLAVTKAYAGVITFRDLLAFHFTAQLVENDAIQPRSQSLPYFAVSPIGAKSDSRFPVFFSSRSFSVSFSPLYPILVSFNSFG